MSFRMPRWRWIAILCGIALGLPLASLAAEPPSADAEPVTRIALGSCLRQNRPAPIWESINAFQPQVFLLLGDNIYGDTEDMEVLRAKYAMLGAQPGFQQLRDRCQLLPIWDDHDYGVNDGGAEYSKKVESQQVFHDFFQLADDSPRRQRPGIYDAVLRGPPGRRVHFILLDTRYFRGPLRKRPEDQQGDLGPYMPTDDTGTTLLGDAQWQWLEQQLSQPAELRIIATSIQFVAAEHGWESWANFPHERRRLIELIAKTGAQGVLFVSGDRHLAEISRLPAEDSGVGYPIYDLTSSSLNQPSGGGNENEPNRYRWGDHFLPVNFGTIRVDWAEPDPWITLAVHDLRGREVRLHGFPLSHLQR